MSTLADELLADFDDSGSEGEEHLDQGTSCFRNISLLSAAESILEVKMNTSLLLMCKIGLKVDRVLRKQQTNSHSLDLGLFPDGEQLKNGLKSTASLAGANGSMELDGDEEEVDEDEEMAGVNNSGVDVEDEEETKAKVEKMELRAVDDVRSVAQLMKKLEPVLEVSTFSIPPFFQCAKSFEILQA